MVSNFRLTNSNEASGIAIGSTTSRHKLSRLTNLFTVPPIPSQAFFTCDVAMKYYSAFILKSSK